MLSHFKWYRRWRGGAWAQTTGYLWGKRWTQLPPDYGRPDSGYPPVQESYGGSPDDSP